MIVTLNGSWITYAGDQQDVVHESKDGAARLMDGDDDGVPLLAQRPQRLHHLGSKNRNKTRNSGVKDEMVWVVNWFSSDCSTDYAQEPAAPPPPARRRSKVRKYNKTPRVSR
jgi:hypothetical protein